MARQTDHTSALLLVIGAAYVLSQLYLTGSREIGRAPQASPASNIGYRVELSPNSNLYDVYENGRTPLHLAAEAGQTDLVGVYLQRGAHIDPPDHGGNTPLILAASAGRDRTVSFLLAKGANISARNRDGRTAFLAALAGGHARTADVLAEAGAEIKAVDRNGYTALHCAAEKGLDEWVKRLLIMRLDPHALRVGGWTPLHLAVHRQHPVCARYLLEAGSDPSARVSYGHSAADIAQATGNLDLRILFREFRVRSTVVPDWMKPPAESGPLSPEAFPKTPRQGR